MTQPRPRLGIHSFLNAMPLVWPLIKGQMEHPFEVVFDTPARLADSLSAGRLDVAMVPSVEVARNPDWRVMRGRRSHPMGPSAPLSLSPIGPSRKSAAWRWTPRAERAS